MTARLSRRLDRELQLVRLADAEGSPMLMAEILTDGRVLIDRNDLWSGIRDAAGRWQRLARRAERSLQTVSEQALDPTTA